MEPRRLIEVVWPLPDVGTPGKYNPDMTDRQWGADVIGFCGACDRAVNVHARCKQ